MSENYSIFKIPGASRAVPEQNESPEQFETLSLQMSKVSAVQDAAPNSQEHKPETSVFREMTTPEPAPVEAVDENLTVYRELTSIAEEIVKCREHSYR